MESLNRKLGYASAFVILLITLGISLRLIKDVQAGPILVKVKFPNVGTLILQDPISMSGVEIGQVRQIEYTGTHALVTMELFSRLQLPKDSKFLNFNHSLMGSRMIFLVRGNSPEKMDFQELQEGIFDEGIAEMLYKSSVMLDIARSYQKMFNQFLYGDTTHPSLITMYRDIWIPLVNNLEKLNQDLNHIQVEYTHLLTKGHSTLSTVNSFVMQTNKTLISLEKNSQEWMTQLESLTASSFEILGKIKSTTASIKSDNSVMGKLIYRRDLFQSLYQLNTNLNTIVVLLGKDGISDIIGFWRNVHILGTNPTKEKKSF